MTKVKQYTCKNCHILVTESKNMNCNKYLVCSKCYRKARCRQQQSIKRGHIEPLELFIENRVVRFTKKKSRKYTSSLQMCKRALAMPKWVDIIQIAEIYGNCPDGMQVDHIIPINGKEVSGLHVPWNLQYLSVNENIRKSNKFELIPKTYNQYVNDILERSLEKDGIYNRHTNKYKRSS